MNVGDQQTIWTQHTAAATVETLLAGFRSPCAFQSEFAQYVNRLGESAGNGRRLRICEMGSEFGVTTLLLHPRRFERCALDLNPRPLELLAEAARRLGEPVETRAGDLFKSGWPAETFDVVFSNGVLEHYDQTERVAALTEFARVTRRGGRVIVGVPNHCSLPYRLAYLLRRLAGRWHYPPENKIATLTRELVEVASLRLERTVFFDQETVFAIWPRSRITAAPFRWLHRWLKFEPYLRVFELARV